MISLRSKKSVRILFILFALLSYPVSAKETLTLPTAIQTKISMIPATKSSWYIRKASGSKAGKQLYGPFENKEQALCVWFFFNLQENKTYCIAKNESFITKKPSTFYKRETEYIKSQITEYGIEAVLDKYFLGIELEIEEMPAIIQSFEEVPVEEPEIQESEPQEEIIQIAEASLKVEESLDTIASVEPAETVENIEAVETVETVETIEAVETKEVVEEEKIEIEVPVAVVEEKIAETTKENLSITSKEPEQLIVPVITETQDVQVVQETQDIQDSIINLPNESISRYKKEYLQDYAPIKTAPLPSEEEEEPVIIIERPNEADSKGKTLLMKACENGNDWEIENLIKSGANVNLKDEDGWTALMYAVRYQQNIAIVKSLINAGAEVKEKNTYGLSALLLAATYNDNPEIIKLLTKQYSISEKELLQSFVMVLTSNTGNEYSAIAKTKAYIDLGIPLNVFYQGKTPLMYAASYTKYTGVIKLLLQNGAQTQIRSVDGKTAFDYANDNKALAHDEYYWALNQK